VTLRADVVDEDRHEARQRRAREDLEAVLSIPAGRRLLFALIESAGAFDSSFSVEAMAMAYAEGRRSVGLELMARIQNVAPNRWVDTLGEALEDRL
jgi:hypothetical protein